MDLAALAGADEGRPDVPASPVQHALLAGGGSSDGGPGADVEPVSVSVCIWERFRGTSSLVKSSQVKTKSSQVISAHSFRIKSRLIQVKSSPSTPSVWLSAVYV